MISIRIASFLMALSLGLASARADALDAWTMETSGVSENLFGVVRGAGNFVAVGHSGVVLVSSNGSFWSPVSSAVSSNLLGVTYANGIFVSVGAGGVICRSTNGLNWTRSSSPTTQTLNGVGFGNGIFIAAGNIGTLLTSPDGVTWTTRLSYTAENLMGAAYGNGLFMAVGRDNSDPGSVITSLDGVMWTDRSYPQLGVAFYAVAYGAGQFVAMDARGVAYTSATGTNWSRRSTANGAYMFGATYAQGLFVGAGGSFSGTSQAITTSADGFTWRLRSVNVTNSAALRAVAYGNGYFVAVGDKGLVLRSGPAFTLRSAVANGGNVEVSLAGEQGRVYRIQENTNFAAGWQDWLTITNTSELMPFIVSVIPGSPRLYRAVTP